MINFLKEFEELEMLELLEDKKYCSVSGINIEKMKSFFNKIPKCRKIYF